VMLTKLTSKNSTRPPIHSFFALLLIVSPFSIEVVRSIAILKGE
jgi:hypothetical protein